MNSGLLGYCISKIKYVYRSSHSLFLNVLIVITENVTASTDASPLSCDLDLPSVFILLHF